jgi:hypothetical protein
MGISHGLWPMQVELLLVREKRMVRMVWRHTTSWSWRCISMCHHRWHRGLTSASHRATIHHVRWWSTHAHSVIGWGSHSLIRKDKRISSWPNNKSAYSLPVRQGQPHTLENRR